MGSVMKGGAVESDRTTLLRNTSWSRSDRTPSPGPSADGSEAGAALGVVPAGDRVRPSSAMPSPAAAAEMLGNAGDDDDELRWWWWWLLLAEMEEEVGAAGREWRDRRVEGGWWWCLDRPSVPGLCL